MRNVFMKSYFISLIVHYFQHVLTLQDMRFVFHFMLVIRQEEYLVFLTPCHSFTVFITLTCAFRYGREDLDVLGLTFRKDLFVANIQAFPPVPEEKKSLTRLQERLIKKLGEHAYPFTFEVNSFLLCH